MAGRKPRLATEGQRVSLGLKVTPEIKNRLDATAKTNGRTQSQEAEARIEQSFRGRDYLDQAMELAFGREPTALLAIIAYVMTDVGRNAAFINSRLTAAGAADWLRDPNAVEDVKQAICEVLAAFQPEDFKPAPNVLLKLLEGSAAENTPTPAVVFARGVMEAVRDPEREDSIGQWAKPIREKLGDLAGQIRVQPGPVMLRGRLPGPLGKSPETEEKQ